ncbi:MAG: dihydroxyacetone kinase subunit DhaL [Rhodobacter sp.]|nr:dihydroxyacetone kinase subunit DhaL [Rhodobacter sp.]
MAVTSADLIRAFGAIADRMTAERDALCALDGEIGDGDHGIGMALGFGAVREALDGLDGGASPTDVLNTAARSFLSSVGASTGPLYATALMRAAAAVKGKDGLEDADAAAIVAAMAEGIAHRGKAEIGQKTMLDAWGPAAEAAKSATGSFAQVLAAAAEAAHRGAEGTAGMQASMGRAARLGERSLGHRDPGAVSAAMIVGVLAETLG